MSALKFKSKIEVPGIDVKGGDITGVQKILDTTGNTILNEKRELFVNWIGCRDQESLEINIDSKYITLKDDYYAASIQPQRIDISRIYLDEDLFIYAPLKDGEHQFCVYDAKGLNPVLHVNNAPLLYPADKMQYNIKLDSWIRLEEHPKWDGNGKPIYWTFTLPNADRIKNFALPTDKSLIYEDQSDSEKWKLIVRTTRTFNNEEETYEYYNELSILVLFNAQNVSEALESSLTMAQQKTLLYAYWSTWDMPGREDCSGLLLGSRPIYENEWKLFSYKNANYASHLGSIPHAASLMVRNNTTKTGAWYDTHSTYPCWVYCDSDGRLQVKLLNRLTEGEAINTRFGYVTAPGLVGSTLECEIVDNSPFQGN